MYPCKNLSAIATRWSRSRSRGGYSDRGAVIAIAERRDISDRNAIKNKSRSRQRCDDRDRREVMAISARWSRSRRDFEKSFPRFQGQDWDPGDEIAIAAAMYLSRRGDRDRGEVIAIISAMIVIATRFWKIVSVISGQDCDPVDEIAIAAALYISRGLAARFSSHIRDPNVRIAILVW